MNPETPPIPGLDFETMQVLFRAIAMREGSAKEISERFNVPIPVLKALVDSNRTTLQAIRDSKQGDVTPAQLEELWISQKAERLKRYETIANQLYRNVIGGNLLGSEYATALRELRSYMQAVAHELGQLMNRGSGDAEGDTLNVSISGMDNLR